MKISATIITYNEEVNIRRCLESLKDFTDEIVLVDSGSTDETKKIAKDLGAKVLHRDWTGYVDQKNFAINHATHNWVLSIDADEELSEKLRRSILKLTQTDSDQHQDGYYFSRIVYYRKKWIRHGDWYPDYLVRLFRKEKGRFMGGKVHERLELDGEAVLLDGELHHYTYKDRQDRVERLMHYAELWAESKATEGKKGGCFKGFFHAVICFLKGYILKSGYLDGALGWEIALGNARATWLKYKRLGEIQRI